MTQVGHSSAAVMTEGGSCDDPGGSQLISRDDPTVTEGGAPWVFRAVHIILKDFPYVIGPGGSLRLPRPRRSLLIPAHHFPALPRHRASSCDRCARLVWASIFTCGVVKYWWFSRPGKKPTLLRQHILFCITNIGKPVLRLARVVWGVGKPVRPISRAKGRPGRAGGCECITTCRA